jgi:molybdopterin converting factor small subunit
MRVQIEFFGISRLITGEKTQLLDFPEGTTFRELVQCLARTYPALTGDVIQSGQVALQPPNVFHLNDSRFIKEEQLDWHLKPNDHIVLMSLSAGG